MAKEKTDWEYLAGQLWEALQPFANSVRDWEVTHTAGDTVMDPARKDTGFGRELAVFRAKYRLHYSDFKNLHDTLKKLSSEGLVDL